MSPVLAVDDHADVGLANPEHLSDLVLKVHARGEHPSDLDHISLFQLRSFATLFPTLHQFRVPSIEVFIPGLHMSLGDGIADILALVTEPQMGGVYAQLYVTFVADLQTTGVHSVR